MEDELLQCASCEATIVDNNGHCSVDGEICQSCYDNHYSVCTECNDIVHQDNTYADGRGDIYCENCYDDLPYCERCEEREGGMDTSSVYSRNGEVCWCQNCLDEYSFYCERCNENYCSSYYDSRNVNRSTMCEGCCEDADVFECTICNCYRTGEQLANEDDDSEEWYCTRCVDSGNMYIHSYSYKPTPKFLKTENDKNNDMFFGIELEVEKADSDVSHPDMAKQIHNENLYYLKRDGSLDNGFEIVTHPMTFNYIQANRETVFLPLLNKLVDNQYRSYDANSCGIHIHMSKQAFGTWQLYRFMKFFIDNRDFVTAISQRKPEKLERWAAIDNDNEDAIIYKAKKKYGNSKRYVAVNLQNQSTVEIRIFRGTLNYFSFMKNVEFCYALFNFTRDSKDTSVNSFKEYIATSNEYTMLKKFIKLKNL